MAEQNDNWTTNEYQSVASFVPKLAGKVLQWLDLKPDDVLLDVGCGDGILNLEFAKILAQGTGSQVGIDASPTMIKSSQELVKAFSNSTFEVVDAGKITPTATLPKNHFTKIFSNAALHWILRPTYTHDTIFPALHSLLKPEGTIVFEMGGLSNVAEVHATLLQATARRVGLQAAIDADPWFFPPEEWATQKLEAAGFRVDMIERQWRSTNADKAGIEGWVRLFGKSFLEVVPEAEREGLVQEVTEILKQICKNPAGGPEVISYVRLRCKATKV